MRNVRRQQARIIDKIRAGHHVGDPHLTRSARHLTPDVQHPVIRPVLRQTALHSVRTNPYAGFARLPLPLFESPIPMDKILIGTFGFSLNFRIFVLIIKRVIFRRIRQGFCRKRGDISREQRSAAPPRRYSSAIKQTDYANDTIFRIDHQR